MLDHLYKGWKNLEPRYGLQAMPRGSKKQPAPMGPIARENVTPLPGYALVNDDPVAIDPAEQIQFLIDETDKVLRDGEKAGAFRTMRPEDREYVRQAILKHIHSGSVGGDSIAALGTKGRTYPVNYKDPSLAGKPIKAQWQPGQRQDRGMQLLLDRAELIDVDTNVGIHGQVIDALHREAAANNPALLTATGNIRPGGASLNRAVGNATGDEYESILRSRKSNLRDEQFLLENGISPTQRGGIDKQTNAENLAHMQMMNKIDEIIKTVGPEELRAYDNAVRQSGKNDKAVTINADTVIMEKAINGNGKK